MVRLLNVDVIFLNTDIGCTAGFMAGGQLLFRSNGSYGAGGYALYM